MAQTQSFERLDSESLIFTPATFLESEVDLVIDTGASHTFIDFGILLKEGVRLEHSMGVVPVSTANGILLANEFLIPHITALGITRNNFRITSYLIDDPEDLFKGVLGLDFFYDLEICINLKNNTIALK